MEEVETGHAEPAVPHAFCRDECPLQANPRRCPWHDRRMLDFWRLEALQQWTERHCPAAATILPALDPE